MYNNTKNQIINTSDYGYYNCAVALELGAVGLGFYFFSFIIGYVNSSVM